MYLKIKCFIAIFIFSGIYSNASIYKTRGHNYSIYKKDIQVLEKILKEDPKDTTALERIIKMSFSIEDYKGVVEYSSRYLNLKKDKNVLFLKIISYANLSQYKLSIKNIDKLLRKYDLDDGEREFILKKRALYQKALNTNGEPLELKKIWWGNDKKVLGLLNRSRVVVGYNILTKSPFFYRIDGNRKKNISKPAIFSGIDFSRLLFFSVSNDEKMIFATVSVNDNNVEIWFRNFDNDKKKWGRWQVPIEINKGSINAFANFINDGDKIIFSSNRHKSRGMDIYISEFDNKNDISSCSPLDGVNTGLDEPSVFLHLDGETLFFSSNGVSGKGGYDIYFSKLKKKKNTYYVTGVHNIVDFNTFRNEVYPPLINFNVEEFYFNYSKGNENYVYDGSLIKEKPEQVTYLDLHVYDYKSKKPLFADVKVIDQEEQNGGRTYEKLCDKHGAATFALKRNHKYLITFSFKGYLYQSQYVSIDNTKNFLEKKFFLRKGGIKKGYSFIADNIYFDTGSSEIRKTSIAALERLHDFLIKNPNIKVKISGYTDNVGSQKYNLKLSNKRAKSIASYLIGMGIKSNRMTTKGFGFANVLASNKTKSGRQKNRRVEILVVSIK